VIVIFFLLMYSY